jgi:RNA polymerase sigma-70 factor (ECF subfamily)
LRNEKRLEAEFKDVYALLNNVAAPYDVRQELFRMYRRAGKKIPNPETWLRHVACKLAEFRDVYDRMSGKVWAIGYRRLNNAAGADDVQQEVFGKYWKWLMAGAEIGNTDAWILVVALHAAEDEARRTDRRKKEQQKQEEQAEMGPTSNDDMGWRGERNRLLRNQAMINTIPSDDPSPLDSVLDAERLAAVRAALDQLPPDQRRVYLWHHRDGRTYAEIAQDLERTEADVKNLQRRASRQLRRTLGPLAPGEDNDQAPAG